MKNQTSEIFRLPQVIENSRQYNSSILVIPDTVFQPEDFLNRTDSNFHPDPLIRGWGGGGGGGLQKFFFGPWGLSLIIVMLYGVTAAKHVLKNCKIVQHRLSPGLIRLCQIIR